MLGVAHRGAEGWIQVETLPHEEETYRQAKPGRPGKDTRYVCQVKTRLELRYEIDIARVTELSHLQGKLLKLLALPATNYGR